MSYAFYNPCAECTKADKCSDRHFVEGAINGIHFVTPYDKGHLGSGSITLDCQDIARTPDPDSE